MRRSGREALEGIVRLVETVGAPDGIRALSKWRPFSLASFRLVNGLKTDGWSFVTVIDVGANAGQFARACLATWPAARVIAFEPLPEVAALLRENLRDTGRVEVHALAVGSTDGETAFRRHAHSLSSSVLEVVPGAESEAWAAEQLPHLNVPVRRLDTILAGRVLDRPVLVKVDVQGFELEVLDGAERTLAGADALLLEAAFEPMYAGQPPFSTVHQKLSTLGWSLHRPLDVRCDSRGRMVEADWLYLPGEAALEP